MQIVRVKTKDGLELSGLLSEPSQKDTIIVHTHGMSGDFYTNPYYPQMHQMYPENNIAFLAGENRGTHSVVQFNSTEGIKNIGNTYEIFEECMHDIEAWVNLARELGYKKIYLQAHSLGPSKVAYYINTVKPKDIAGLLFISPSDMLGLVYDPEGKEDHTILYPEAKKLVDEGKPKQLLSQPLWGEYKLSAGTYVNFFRDTSNTAIFNYGRPDLGWDAVNKITLPVLAITGTKDDGIVPCMEPHKAMETLEKELKSSPKVKTVVYEGAEHSFEGFEERIVKEVISFIESIK